MQTTFIFIDPQQIHIPDTYPRQIINADDTTEFALTLKDAKGKGIGGTGILQALVVRKDAQGRYLLVSGKRRLLAAQEANLPQIPAFLSDADSLDAFEYSLIENVQHKRLSDWDEANALKHIMQERHLSVIGLAHTVGRSETYVRNRLNLLKMQPEVAGMVQRNPYTISSAKVISKIKNPKKREKLIKQVDQGASFQTVKKAAGPKKPEPVAPIPYGAVAIEKPRYCDPIRTPHTHQLLQELRWHRERMEQIAGQEESADFFTVAIEVVEEMTENIDLMRRLN